MTLFLRRLTLIFSLCSNVAISIAQSSVIDSIITPSSLKLLVQKFAADSFQGRLTGTENANRAANEISEEFIKAGILPYFQNDGYCKSFLFSKKQIAFNVIAAIPGCSKAREMVIFSAHYDHVGKKSDFMPYRPPERGKPEKGDVIYNGANDNASGIAGLLHLARYFARLQNNERTLIFIAFSGEEEGLLGSSDLAGRFNQQYVKAVINMDMIGRPLAANKKYPYITGNTYSDLQTIINNKLYSIAPQYGNSYFANDAFPMENLYKRSDNYPFTYFGIVAHTIICTSPIDMYYHSLNDEWQTLDYSFMADVVKAIALGCSGLTDGSQTPVQQKFDK
jgi:hypothetical protein